MEQAPCPGCGTPVNFEPVFRLGTQTIAPYCEECRQKQEREWHRESRNVILAHHWSRICPDLFRDTQFDKLPCQDKSTKALDWRFDQGRGLNLWGLPRTGKTRTMYLILEKLHKSGATIAVFNPTEFSAELERRGFNRASWAQSLARKDVLAIDDMDKLSLTKPQEKTLFGLLDNRMTRRKPCIFTHNSSAKELTFKFNLGEPLVARIRDFAQSIHFP